MRTSHLAAVLIATGGHALAADHDARAALLGAAHAETVSLSLHAAPAIKISAQTQFNYNMNLRDDSTNVLGDNDTTIGFVMRRTRINVAGAVTDDIDAKVQIDFSRTTGTATLQEAYADWAVSDGVTLRIGQQKVHFMRETTVGSAKQLSAESSVTDAVFGQGYAQFVEAAFGADAWRGWVAFSDGFGSQRTAFNSGSEADYALTGRAEFRLGDADWKVFDQFTSWRGTTAGGLVGAAAHWQSTGDTNPAAAANTEVFTVTGDFQWAGDGWNAAAIGVWRNTDGPAGDFDDYGFLMQGGVFLSDRAELFARYDFVSPDDTRAPSVGATVDDFSTLTAGLNYYIVPESHAAKFTLAIAYYFDAVSNTGGVVTPSDGLNLLADTEDGQVGITAQLQLLF